jgi:hypothetical protein
MDHPPVVNYGRIKRITNLPKENPMELGTSVCLVIILLTLMYLYKRYQDKSRPQSDTVDTLWM